jgi:hypothetical protein
MDEYKRVDEIVGCTRGYLLQTETQSTVNLCASLITLTNSVTEGGSDPERIRTNNWLETVP